MLANILFRDSDRRLNWNHFACRCLRWSDDHEILASTYEAAVEGFGLLRETIESFGLKINSEKTLLFHNSEEMEELRKNDVGSLPIVAAGRRRSDVANLESQLAHELESEKANLTRLRFLMKTLVNSKSSSRPSDLMHQNVVRMLDRPESWRFAPTEGAEYLRLSMSVDQAARAIFVAEDLSLLFPEQTIHLVRSTRERHLWSNGRACSSEDRAQRYRRTRGWDL